MIFIITGQSSHHGIAQYFLTSKKSLLSLLTDPPHASCFDFSSFNLFSQSKHSINYHSRLSLYLSHPNYCYYSLKIYSDEYNLSSIASLFNIHFIIFPHSFTSCLYFFSHHYYYYCLYYYYD
jgi:hypothetical protein